MRALVIFTLAIGATVGLASLGLALAGYALDFWFH